MYVRVGDSQIIYDLDSVDYGILSDASYDDLRHGSVFRGDFADVTQVDITLENASHTLVSRLNEEEAQVWYYQTGEMTPEATEESTDASEETGEADGETEEEEQALDLTDFKHAVSALYANSFTTEAPTGREEIRFTLHLDNETFPTLEIALYRHDGSECLAVIDGESISLVPRSSVVELVEAVQTIVLNIQ